MGEHMTEDKLPNSMLTVREVSQLLHVHSNTLRRWSDQGILKAYRIGPRGDRRFRAEDIAVLLLQENKGIPFETQEKVSDKGTERYAMSR
jgi:excisionase family DNA binding protein